MSEKDEVKGIEGIEESKLPIISSAKDIFEKVNTGELVKALENRVTGAWAYQFPMEGKEIRGLSAPGADEACLFIAQESKGQTVIRTIPGSLRVTEEPDCFKAEVTAGVFVLGFIKDKPAELMLSTHIGYSKQMKFGIRKDKSTWDIPHAEVLAVRKAERNAKSHAIPDRIKAEIMKMALKMGKVSPTDTETPESAEPSEETTPPVNNKATEAQISYLEKLVKSTKVGKETRERLLAEMKKPMAKERANGWIKMLKPIVEAELV